MEHVRIELLVWSFIQGMQAKDELACFISWPYLFWQRARERERRGEGGAGKTRSSVSNKKRSLGLFTFWLKRSTGGKKRSRRRV